jgi:hypothetical protein
MALTSTTKLSRAEANPPWSLLGRKLNHGFGFG